MFPKYKLVAIDHYNDLQNQIIGLQKEVEVATDFIMAMGTDKTEEVLSKMETNNSTVDNGLIWELKQLQQKLKKITEEEKQRNWSSEGQALFANILSNNGSGLEDLTSLIISQLVKYVNANQSSLFILTEEDGKEILKMVACYAYGRKKFLHKAIDIGEGLVGQVFLEKETTLLSEIPDNYVSITSGLGEAKPRCIVIVPIKFNDEMLGVMELASFQVFPPHVIEFLEKVGEAIGSAISNVKVTEKTQRLLHETQAQTEQMRAQEEELRQNLEELNATQEEMARKQLQLDQSSKLTQIILDNIPLPTFVKDDQGKYTLANKAELELLGVDAETILGKDDSYFTSKEEELLEIRNSDIEALQSPRPIELPMQSFTTSNGRHYVFKTTKVSFLNTLTGKRNIIGVSVDLTDRVKLEQRLISEKVVKQNNVLIDLTGRQRMLSQKIGFCAEMIFRGQKHQAPVLRQAIDLHDHSLEIIKKGGWPQGIEVLAPIDKAHDELLPHIHEVEDVWYTYKDAAEKIIYLSMLPISNPEEMEEAITVIEYNGAKLLDLNNQLLMQYKKITQKSLMELKID